MASYWEYLRWVAYIMAAGVTAWKYLPLAVVRLVAICSHDEEPRARRALEVLRLARRDAASIPSYLNNTTTVINWHHRTQDSG
jgi:hypothetical protein